jgi:REP element-mobilizing transposase RayT
VSPQEGFQKPSHLVSGLHTRNTLPHLKREGGAYFVTFRLFGTLPRELVARLKAERETILRQALAAKRPLTWQEQDELFRWYSARVDAHLDAGHGGCFLKQPEIADLVANALRFFDGQRCRLHAWVVMPNHVHAVVHPNASETLSDILHSWKSFTAKQALQIIPKHGTAFWQKENYDHLTRNDDDTARCCAYTTMNPVAAGLCRAPEQWKWSSTFREVP